MVYKYVLVNLLSFACGNVYAWFSPVLPYLKNSTDLRHNPLGRTISMNEEAFIVGLVPFGCILGCPLGGYLATRLGKRLALILAGPPMIIGNLLFSFGASVNFYFAAQLLCGISSGMCCVLVPVYVSELADKENRGAIGVLFGIFVKLGIFFAYCLGPYVSMMVYGLVSCIPMVIYMIVFIFLLPETPYHLASSGEIHEAEKALRKFRRNDTEPDIQKEFSEITDYVESVQGDNKNINEVLQSKSVKRSFAFAALLLAFQQLTGYIPIITYMHRIFDESGSNLGSDIASIAVGLVQVLIACVSSKLIDRFGRRVLLLISIVGIFICLVILGVYFFLKHNNFDTTSYSWLPLACLVAFLAAMSLGMGPVAWVFVGEIFETGVKPMGAAFAHFICMTIIFLVTITFSYVSEGLGMYGSFWLFSCFTFVGIIFVAMFIPETKSKTFAEIKDILEDRLLQINKF